MVCISRHRRRGPVRGGFVAASSRRLSIMIFLSVLAPAAARAGTGALPPVLNGMDVATVYTCAETRLFYIDGINLQEG
ncbi:MAG: hypothetical protein MI923_03910, partial [Phycisphaerales bacterium]|nr:hypothetical protein [Phycisphaerales bacterium]